MRISYLDKPHMYYKQERVNWQLPETDDRAWGKKTRPKGTTTLLSDTLEKKGLMTWPLGMALRELFGFYGDFVASDGAAIKAGFSKNQGTLWNGDMSKGAVLPLVISASKAWQRRQKQGADVGNVVHDAIEQLCLGTPFELTLEKYESYQDFPDDLSRLAWLETAAKELEMAKLAFGQFKDWWGRTSPTLVNAEQVVYSRQYDVTGTYDAVLEIGGQRVLTDYKTSNASVSAGAPMGVYYSYFIQSAAYAHALMEMGEPLVDDLMIVSCRKDGGFSVVRASEVGLTIEDALAWWDAVARCYRYMNQTKYQLTKLAEK